ncbi:ASCH domain-containing protein [Lactobacillus sp. PSON]|uniref:ASCH domain-containing protein n=1 Tax=Lactobacillus sp. PSON TaxID=3455454 RepID=UPI0040434661
MDIKLQKYWHEFCKKHNLDVNTPIEAFAFGRTDEEANYLADLVNKGIKTATTSAYDFYIEDSLPKAGNYSIILNANDEPVCVIRNTDVQITPYNKITPEYAFLEGEGDRSYKYWREVHDEFFKQEFKEQLNEAFDPKSLMVCEFFEKID